jgi:hypothetical protein
MTTLKMKAAGLYLHSIASFLQTEGETSLTAVVPTFPTRLLFTPEVRSLAELSEMRRRSLVMSS